MNINCHQYADSQFSHTSKPPSSSVSLLRLSLTSSSTLSNLTAAKLKSLSKASTLKLSINIDDSFILVSPPCNECVCVIFDCTFIIPPTTMANRTLGQPVSWLWVLLPLNIRHRFSSFIEVTIKKQFV
ncbi:hypothetical protein CRENBAI_005614 [Crenichthys baileyi]|uniref:Uncharacterized protein n=1 Tax=Crenichthys baileyi TaxID=28760 RepID=A0AAV9RUX5_9TELE